MPRLNLLLTSLTIGSALACAPTATPAPLAPEAATVAPAPAAALATDEPKTPSSGVDAATSAGAKRSEPGPIPAPDDVAAPPAHAEKTASGLSSILLKAGTSTEHPTAESRVVVSYTGWTKDGEMFDSSELRGHPATFTVTRVISGLTEGLLLMTKGEKRRFWIPSDLAYGDVPENPQAPAGQLTFDVELLDIVSPPKAPEDVARPPATATKTKSGLASRVLEPGSGSEHPGPTSKVTVNYTGWTTDGKMFDSSVMRGQPSTFGLDQLIEGWTEGIQLMVVGEKRRFWIPEKLAYKGHAGAPAGMLVFDVELIAIE